MQVLYSYPSDRTPELGHVGLYCFPHGVQPRVVKRTPSLTALNQFFCGQQYSNAETSSFIFYAKVCPGACWCCLARHCHVFGRKPEQQQ